MSTAVLLDEGHSVNAEPLRSGIFGCQRVSGGTEVWLNGGAKTCGVVTFLGSNDARANAAETKTCPGKEKITPRRLDSESLEPLQSSDFVRERLASGKSFS